MQVTATPAPKSSVQLEVEVPSERLDRAVRDAVGRLGRRQRIPGFRPGKAPRGVLETVLGPGAVLDDAVDHLVQDAYREAIVSQKIVPLTNADVEVLEAQEGKPVRFKAMVQVRPAVKLGDYRGFNFRPEIERIDDAKVDRVIEDLRDQNATLAAVEDRGLADGDYATVGFEGTIDGQPFEGGSAERLPMVVGQERVLPGFQEHLKGMRPDETREFDLVFPTGDEIEEGLRGKTARFTVTLKELRQKVLPELDDDFASNFGDFADLAALRADVRRRLERNAIDAARHGFADRIIQYAVANATLELPDILVDREVEVMHDEFRATLARQGIAEQAYLQTTGQSEADLHDEFRPRAEQRTKTLLVLTEIARAEGLTVPQSDVEAEVAKARGRSTDQKIVKYFESERGREVIQSTLRRSRVVEGLVDEWLAKHPEHPPLVHREDQEASPVDAQEAHAAASIGVTDPAVIPGASDDEPTAPTAIAAGRQE